MTTRKKNIKQFIDARILSFSYAFRGLLHVFKTQQNAWIHFAATIGVLLISFWLQIPKSDWITILLVISIVWIAEFLNTALEVIVDLVSPEKHPLAKIGKDVGAAAVLIAAIISLIIGVLVFWSPFFSKMGW